MEAEDVFVKFVFRGAIGELRNLGAEVIDPISPVMVEGVDATRAGRGAGCNQFKYDLKVNIPAKHFVDFLIEKSMVLPGTFFSFPRKDRWKPKSIPGEFAGDKSVELDLEIPQKVTPDEGRDVNIPGNSFEITTGWVCYTGLADVVARGSFGMFKFKGVEKKKKK